MSEERVMCGAKVWGEVKLPDVFWMRVWRWGVRGWEGGGMSQRDEWGMVFSFVVVA